MASRDCWTHDLVVQVRLMRLISLAFEIDQIPGSFLVKDACEDMAGERLKA